MLKERAGWAKERLSLQMSLNLAEREIDQLQTDLRVERERRVAAGITDTKETDKVKVGLLQWNFHEGSPLSSSHLPITPSFQYLQSAVLLYI